MEKKMETTIMGYIGIFRYMKPQPRLKYCFKLNYALFIPVLFAFGWGETRVPTLFLGMIVDSLPS